MDPGSDLCFDKNPDPSLTLNRHSDLARISRLVGIWPGFHDARDPDPGSTYHRDPDPDLGGSSSSTLLEIY